MSGFLGGLLDSIGVTALPPGLLDAPVGTSTMQRLTNPSPYFSPLASSATMTNEQRLGRFWNAATGRAKPYTNADLDQLSKAGREAYDAAAGFVNSTNPIRAYHGSPHTFDRFDMSKIGTGEGAQAYGHGLYFAGNEGVARGYKDTLSGGKLLTKDGVLLDADGLAGAEGIAARFLASHGGDFAEALKEASRFNDPAAMRAAFAKLEAAGAKPAPGSMYEVSLRTSPERLLDWDKPISAQPKTVQDAVSRAMVERGLPTDASGVPLYLQRSTPPIGLNVHASLAPVDKGQAGAADLLRKHGIDGIQYLDAGSRAAGEGSRNYVMFRDDIIDILKRYGLLGMFGGGAAAGALEQ